MFRIAHFSVQADHLHLLVEAADRRELLRGMRGFNVSLARQVNRLLFRRGRLVAERWHGRALSTPRAVRQALIYVLANFKKHREHARALVDPYSSAIYFAGFSEYGGRSPVEVDQRLARRAAGSRGPPIPPPKSWLLTTGWRRHGALSVFDAPKSSPTDHRR
jgi:hypothetical protein